MLITATVAIAATAGIYRCHKPVNDSVIHHNLKAHAWGQLHRESLAP
jgi:hypothetical protein